MAEKIKKIVERYEYGDLGFLVILNDVLVIKNRGYEYAQINHRAIMNAVAHSLVIMHESLDGPRLKFLRRFINFSLDDLAALIGVSKSTLHGWEKDAGRTLEISDEKLRLIFLKVRDVLSREVTDRLDAAIIKDIVKPEVVSPLEISGSDVR